MDKETLSRFGWIIVSAVVVTVIMAFVFSLVWVLGDDSVDSAKDILVISPEETPKKEEPIVGEKPVVTVGRSLFGRFEYQVSGTGFDTIRFYKNGEFMIELNDETGGHKEFKFTDNEIYYERYDAITVKCYKKGTLIASGDGVYDFFDDKGPDLTVSVSTEPNYVNNNTYYVKNNTVTINGTVTDGEYGSDIKEFTVNGTDVTVQEDGSWSTSIALTQGTNNVTILAIDGSNNSTTETVTVYYDNVAPTLTVSTPNDGTVTNPILVYGNSAYMVSGTVSDGTGVGIQTVKINGKNATVNGDGSWSISIELDSLEVTSITVVATDKLGNKTTSVARYLRWINWPDNEGALQFMSTKPFSISAPTGSWNNNGENQKMEYHNGFGWQTWKAGDTIRAEKRNEEGTTYCLYIRGTGFTKVTKTSGSGDGFTVSPWEIIGNNVQVQCSGNIETLLDYKTVENGNNPSMADACFAGMFEGQTALTKAPSLPATQLSAYCYHSMFQGTSITEVPELGATTLADHCYRSMFQGCTKLIEVPDELLLAKELKDHCYQSMFEGCKKLEKAPELPATTVAGFCYYRMFYKCESLTDAPSELPAELLLRNGVYNGTHCYAHMFDGCSSLETAPKIVAHDYMSYAACAYMFKDCKNLKTAPPELNAWLLTQYCYQGMFMGCTSLTKAPEMPRISNLNLGSCMDMFNGCTALTTVSKMDNLKYLSKESCKNMFKDCTSLTEVPSGLLPAINLNTVDDETEYNGLSCYESMFQGCTNLTTAPELPATTLAEKCYANMFYGCEKLTTPPSILGAEKLEHSCYWGMFAKTGLIAIPEDFLSAEFLAPNCCAHMFEGCTGLTELPANLLHSAAALFRVDNGKNYDGSGCYSGMFSGCTGLTAIPENFLPAKNLAYGCYIEMFKGCTKLVTVPKNLLPSTNTGNGAHKNAYQGMFSGCTSLKVAPDLPATILAEGCYDSMFLGCTSLEVAPDLPATVLYRKVGENEYIGKYCYRNMFSGCTSLAVAPELPATVLAEGCYQNMFLGCTGLTSIPELPADTLPANCYNSMFKGCEKIKVSQNETDDYMQPYYIPAKQFETDSLANMFDGTGGPFVGTPTSPYTYYLPSYINIIKAPAGYIEFVSTGSFTLGVKNNGGGTLEYNVGNGWIRWDGKSTIPSGQNSEGYYIYIRGTNNSVITGGEGSSWTLTGTNIECNGNIETLLDYKTVKEGNNPKMDSQCFRDMFLGCTSLIKAPQLLATTLTEECYRGMFYGCKGLTEAPALPATALSSGCYYGMFMESGLTTAPVLSATTLKADCYREMFMNCESLGAAPSLNATTLATSCYQNMFSGCTSLTTSPALPAKTLADSCYYEMFSGCSKLTKASAISATTAAANSCYRMFYNCTGLKTAPTLSATTLASNCYQDMFMNCKGLVNAPVLPAITLATSCYQGMFYGCTGLTTAPTLNAMTLADACYQNMFYGCTSLKTAPVLPATTLKASCYYGMFKGCTELTTVQPLSATKLASNCCREMFMNCTSLKTVARNFLSATTLASDCYRAMFQGCTDLETVPLLPATTLSAGCYAYMFYGCANLEEIPYLPATTLANHCYNYMFGDAIKSVSAVRTDAYRTEYTIPVTKAHVDSKTHPISQMFGEGTSNSYYTIFNTDVAPFYLPTGIKVVGKDFLEFASTSSFTITIPNMAWDKGTLQYSTDGITWKTVEIGKAINSTTSDYHYIYMRGSGITGTRLVKSGNEIVDEKETFVYYPWRISGNNVYCNGNIEYLLDYASVMQGQHPKMGTNCYTGMFAGSTALVKAPELPATALTSACYRSMFQDCKNLTKAPELPAITTVHQCYNYMFAGCTSLINAPELPATNAANSCYSNMFNGCTSLVTAPALPATKLEIYCYYNMFRDCKNLKQIPYLPATELKDHCYNYMFYGAISISTTSNATHSTKYGLPVETILGINYPISQLFTNINVDEFIKKPLVYLPSDITVVGTPSLEFVSDSTIKIEVKNPGWTNTSTSYMEYSTDNETWNKWNGMTEVTAVRGEDGRYHIYFRGTNISVVTGGTDKSWTITGSNVYCNGNIETLLDYHTAMGAGQHPTMGEYCYAFMFNDCDVLVKAPDLPAEILTKGCYQHMFAYCDNLTVAPALPATTLAGNCYDGMFYNCTNLTTIPHISATAGVTNSCIYMFSGCTKIKISETYDAANGYTQPYYLPATSAGGWIYEYMFRSINSGSKYANNTDSTKRPTPGKIYYLHSSIKVVGQPCLEFVSENATFSVSSGNNRTWTSKIEYSQDGTTWYEWNGGKIFSSLGKDGSYHLYFRGTGNTVITGEVDKGWILEGTNIKCNGNIETLLDYTKIMSGASITMGDFCFRNMFHDCIGLVKAPDLPATTLSNGCYQRMFDGCTNLTVVPALPATSLKEYCYDGMFAFCISLRTIPHLPATTSVLHSYIYMFQGCTSIKISTTKTGNYTQTYVIFKPTSKWHNAEMFTGTGGTFTDVEAKNGTYYLDQYITIVYS